MKIDRRKSMGALSILLMLVLAACAYESAVAASADEYGKTIQTFKKSPVVQPLFKTSYGYAVFPTIGKGGVGIGAAYGKGKVYAGGKVTGTSSLIKLSVGWQLGGQAVSEIIFFENKEAYDQFTTGEFEFDAEASAIAITAGVEAQAGTQGTRAEATAGTTAQAESNYRKGMAVFVYQKGGLMYEAAVGGQKFGFTPNKK